jgi:ABC-type ATPase with predicted acetyltransferase domain
MGLTPVAERFVRKRVRALGLPARYPVQQPPRRWPGVQSPIEVKGCTLTLSAPLIRTAATRKVQQAFGVSRDMLTTTLFAGLNFTICPGDIVLLCGPSGAGKTTLLSLLSKRLADPSTIPEGMTGSIEVLRAVKVGTLGPLSSARPLISALGQRSFERSLFALNVSGLAEAHLYVKRFRELSNGQKYRAMVAKLIASDADVWVADEFCATLDPITANIVSRNLRRCAKSLGVTVILAAANWSEFIHELRPDTIVHLRSPWDCRVFSWDEFRRAICSSQALAWSGDSLGRDRVGRPA